MPDIWTIDLNHFLDEVGDLITEPKEAGILGEYFAAIVLMVSFPDIEHPPEYNVRCRRRPKRQPCMAEIAGWIEPESDDIFWVCPKCHDSGRISNWRGSIWDMSDSEQTLH